MQTECMPNARVWLENAGGEDRAPRRTDLESFPFTIGRGESCALQIDVNRVSREHATIDQHGGQFRLLDLGSTNGTFVNGRRIHESELHDGDTLAFADSQFCFRCIEQSHRNAVTQVFHVDADDDDETTDGWRLIREIRQLREQLTQSAVDPQMEPILDLCSGELFGLAAAFLRRTATTTGWQLLERGESRLLNQTIQVGRTAAVEEASRTPQPLHLFVPIEPCQSARDELAVSLEKLCRLAPGNKRLVVEIPGPVVSNVPYFREVLEVVRGLDIAVAYDGFTGTPTEIAHLSENPPDYVKLADCCTRLQSHSDQRRRQLKGLTEAAEANGCRVVALDALTTRHARDLRELGCQLVQQPQRYCSQTTTPVWAEKEQHHDIAEMS